MTDLVLFLGGYFRKALVAVHKYGVIAEAVCAKLFIAYFSLAHACYNVLSAACVNVAYAAFEAGGALFVGNALKL